MADLLLQKKLASGQVLTVLVSKPPETITPEMTTAVFGEMVAALRDCARALDLANTRVDAKRARPVS